MRRLRWVEQQLALGWDRLKLSPKLPGSTPGSLFKQGIGASAVFGGHPPVPPGASEPQNP